MANKLQVKICGQEYTLVSDDSREYMLEMADYVDRKMVAVKNQNNRLSTSMAAILVALNVADDMKRAEAEAKEALNSQAAEIALLKKKLDESAKKLAELQKHASGGAGTSTANAAGTARHQQGSAPSKQNPKK